MKEAVHSQIEEMNKVMFAVGVGVQNGASMSFPALPPSQHISVVTDLEVL